MKTRIKLSILSILVILFSCGKDGNDGVATVALDWDWYVDVYSDNNPALPSIVERNFNYSSQVGSFQGVYLCSNGSGDEWYWNFTYSISINKGEKGKLFRKGENGKRKQHKIFLNGLSQPTITSVNKSASENTKPLKPKLEKVDFSFDDAEIRYVGDEQVDVIQQDDVTIVFKRRKFTLK